MANRRHSFNYEMIASLRDEFMPGSGIDGVGQIACIIGKALAWPNGIQEIPREIPDESVVEIKDLGRPDTIGQLRSAIAGYPSEVSFGFRGGPLLMLQEVKWPEETFVVFEEEELPLPPGSLQIDLSQLPADMQPDEIRSIMSEGQMMFADITNYEVCLSEIMHQVGYKPGPINIIALLGLGGEVAEVYETFLLQYMNFTKKIFEGVTHDADTITEVLYGAMNHAAECDILKKRIRDRDPNPLYTWLPPIIAPLDESAFDLEIADLLYYVLAIAICRGKTLNDYLHLSYDKVKEKFQVNIEHGKHDLEMPQKEFLNAKPYLPYPGNPRRLQNWRKDVLNDEGADIIQRNLDGDANPE